MSQQAVTMRELRELPQHERREVLEDIVLREFRTALLMADDEDFPTATGFFDLGLTSLRLSEIKQNLEATLGCDIDTAVLFNRPTVGQLIDHLSE